MVVLKNIEKTYNKARENECCALRGIDLVIKKGEMVAVIGKSGAGKSTLLHILACIDKWDAGEYFLNGEKINEKNDRELADIRNKYIGVVMQEYALINDFSVLENILLPLDFSKNKISKKKEIAMNALREVGMETYARKPISQLSGGQKQRVAIARAIVNKPLLLLADEPTGALDSENGTSVIELFKRLNQKGMTCVIITHDNDIASECERVVNICDGILNL